MVKQQRSHERIEYRIPITIRRANDAEHKGESKNISLGGMFIVINEPFKYGEVLTLSFKLPDMKELASVSATIRWTTADGFGVQFGSLRAIETWAINQLFRKS